MRGNNGFIKYDSMRKAIWFHHPNGAKSKVGDVKMDGHQCKGVSYKDGEHALLHQLDKIDERMFDMDENELMLTFFTDIRTAFGNSQNRWERPDYILYPWTGWVHVPITKEWEEADKVLIRHDIEIACEHQIQVRKQRLEKKQ